MGRVLRVAVASDSQPALRTIEEMIRLDRRVSILPQTVEHALHLIVRKRHAVQHRAIPLKENLPPVRDQVQGCAVLEHLLLPARLLEQGNEIRLKIQLSMSTCVG